MSPRRIEVEIGRLVVDDPALARIDVAAALERELGQLARAGSAPRLATAQRGPRSQVSAIAREIHGRLGR